MIDYRDESDFSDSIAIVGLGPIGKYSIDDPPPRPQTMHNGAPDPPGQGEIVLKNADGYIYALGPQLDGYLPQGAKVDSRASRRSRVRHRGRQWRFWLAASQALRGPGARFGVGEARRLNTDGDRNTAEECCYGPRIRR